MRKCAKQPNKDERTIRIILTFVVSGWALALILMGVAMVFWDRQ